MNCRQLHMELSAIPYRGVSTSLREVKEKGAWNEAIKINSYSECEQLNKHVGVCSYTFYNIFTI